MNIRYMRIEIKKADAGFILRLLFAVDRKNCVYRILERKAFSHRAELLQKMADIAKKRHICMENR